MTEYKGFQIHNDYSYTYSRYYVVLEGYTMHFANLKIAKAWVDNQEK